MIVWVVNNSDGHLWVFVLSPENLFRRFLKILSVCCQAGLPEPRSIVDRDVFPPTDLPIRPAVHPYRLDGTADHVPIKENIFSVSVPIAECGRTPSSLRSRGQR